jgi:alpha-L-fucosidase
VTYQPALKLLRQRSLPDWFNDAKLGIFIHWGLYSVPGWAPLTGEQQEVVARCGWTHWFAHNPYAEWYLNSIRIEDSPSHRHHVATYGADFSYDEFAPRFNQAAANLNPDAWADLFASAGARYVVLVTKHHDGFTLWPSQHLNPHKPGYHAERDLVGEIVQAVRHLADLVLAIPQNADYVAYANGQMRELIDRYQPAVLWNDIGYPAAASLKELFAYYYNAVPDGGRHDPDDAAGTAIGVRGMAVRERRGDLRHAAVGHSRGAHLGRPAGPLHAEG